eukprot:TRINITY_DN3380_c0_g1_i1.p1 TRINITY_DN3380_c0_g1~~TRINITY_DN3380_c0_g1_i1.p1  ORF type:complete len:520 (-),score=96.95 TRINITY_DN3380_c0_g1_i1:577-2022(-)
MEAPETDPLLHPPASLDSICYEITAIQDQARQGQWKSLLQNVDHARRFNLIHKPHEKLTYVSYSILALAKLRKYSEAVQELETLEDFDHPKYKYESYPSIYGSRCGSMVPFSLRCLHAQLPFKVGRKQESLDRLYALLDFVRNKIAHKNPNFQRSGSGTESRGLQSQKDLRTHLQSLEITSEISGSGSLRTEVDSSSRQEALNSSASVPSFPFTTQEEKDPNTDDALGNHDAGDKSFQEKDESSKTEEGTKGEDSETLNLDTRSVKPDPSRSETKDNLGYLTSSLAHWRRREEIVINSIICHHLSQKEYTSALKWVEKLLEGSPSDPLLLSKLGQIQLQVGDLKGANETFSRVGETALTDPRPETRNIVHRNRALQHLVTKDFIAAVREYEAVLESDPTDIIATNNKALCLMYSRELLGSIKVLENALERMPSVALNENVVLNLCSMYELAFVSNAEAKRSLSSWILQVAPDDFDLSCTRL